MQSYSSPSITQTIRYTISNCSPRATKKGRRWKTGKAEHELAFGQAGKGEGGGVDNFCGRRTISTSGLCPWGTESASGLCPGGQNLLRHRYLYYSITFLHLLIVLLTIRSASAAQAPPQTPMASSQCSSVHAPYIRACCKLV